MTPNEPLPTRRHKLVAVWTHPVQYLSPWFRSIHESQPDIDLTVLYVTDPTPAQQAAGFDGAFSWDVPLTEGYNARTLRSARAGDDVRSGSFFGVDAKGIGAAVVAERPDAVLLPGWYSVALVKVLWACKRAKIPVIYRGDSTLGSRRGGWKGGVGAVRGRALLRRFDIALSVGVRSDAYLRRLGMPPQRVVRAPHCIDVERFARAADEARQDRAGLRRSLGIDEDAFVVLLAGKLESIKRPTDAVQAVAGMPPGAVLAIAGDGPLRESVEAEAYRSQVRVALLGFRNQSEMPAVYAAADCLVLPSQSETWGLVVNEALACGVPCVVSDTVGCAPDLISGAAGAVFPMGDPAACTSALQSVRRRVAAAEQQVRDACLERATTGSFEAATRGLRAALDAVARTPTPAAKPPTRGPRVLALCGGMVMVYGVERMTFAILGYLRKRNVPVHCVFNEWENHRIVPLAEGMGATWSTGRYRVSLSKRLYDPRASVPQVWDALVNIGAVLRAAVRHRPTHVFAPEWGGVLRHGPGLALLRWFGVRVFLRVSNAPDERRLDRWMWRLGITPFTSRVIAISRFCRQRLEDIGVPPRKLDRVSNTIMFQTRRTTGDKELVELIGRRRTLLYVGQVAQYKGVHLLIEATARLRAAGEDVQAVIVGAMPTWPPAFVTYAESLRTQATEAGIAEFVHFVGQREDVPGAMQAAWLFVAPILQEETFGTVMMEAKWMGLPIVTFRRGALPESVEHEETGYLCATEDLDGLMQGLQWFVDEPSRRDAAAQAALAFFQSERGREYLPATFEAAWVQRFRRIRNPSG